MFVNSHSRTSRTLVVMGIPLGALLALNAALMATASRTDAPRLLGRAECVAATSAQAASEAVQAVALLSAQAQSDAARATVVARVNQRSRERIQAQFSHLASDHEALINTSHQSPAPVDLDAGCVLPDQRLRIWAQANAGAAGASPAATATDPDCTAAHLDCTAPAAASAPVGPHGGSGGQPP